MSKLKTSLECNLIITSLSRINATFNEIFAAIGPHEVDKRRELEDAIKKYDPADEDDKLEIDIEEFSHRLIFEEDIPRRISNSCISTLYSALEEHSRKFVELVIQEKGIATKPLSEHRGSLAEKLDSFSQTSGLKFISSSDIGLLKELADLRNFIVHADACVDGSTKASRRLRQRITRITDIEIDTYDDKLVIAESYCTRAIVSVEETFSRWMSSVGFDPNFQALVKN